MAMYTKRVAQKIAKLSDDQVEQLFDALTEENEVLESIIESLATGLVICDDDYHLLQSNKAAERFLPFINRSTDSNKIDLKVWDLIDDADVSEFLESSYKSQKSNVSEEFTIVTSGGSSRFIVVSMMPLVRSRKITGNIITIEDITEKRNQDTLLRRMESLASLTNLAASVAHEIKNPLGSISIHIQLIQKTMAKARKEGKLPDEKYAEKYLEIVNQEIDRLNQIIVDFLFAVRPISASLESVDINEMLNRFASFFSPELESKNIQLSMCILKDSPRLMLDEKLFKQVIINLVQNAIAAMPDGGKLIFSSKIQDERYILNIADNGIGMDEDTVARVFEPYFTTKTKGTGLGLTMVYKIIKEFSGDITVQSYKGEGSVFSISLPIPQKERRLLQEKVE